MLAARRGSMTKGGWDEVTALMTEMRSMIAALGPLTQAPLPHSSQLDHRADWE